MGDIIKLSASAAASKLCESVQARTDVYLPHGQYHVKPHVKSSWFCCWNDKVLKQMVLIRIEFSEANP